MANVFGGWMADPKLHAIRFDVELIVGDAFWERFEDLSSAFWVWVYVLDLPKFYHCRRGPGF